jgi:hypothetical protein
MAKTSLEPEMESRCSQCGIELPAGAVCWMLNGGGELCLSCHDLNPERPGWVDMVNLNLGELDAI